MSNRYLIFAVIVAAVLVTGGIWLYNWVLGDTQQASAPISAPTLELPAATAVAVEPTKAAPTDAPAIVETEALLGDSSSGDSTVPSDTTGAGLVVYQISQEGSQVRFNIFEELRGAPKDVIGVSDQVAGEIAVDLGDLGNTQVGVIQINARTLVTDEDRRNQAIRNRILNTDQYEFITFTPTQVIGLSGGAVAGQSFSFQIAGDLTIRDITKPVVFDVSATLAADGRITGSASTTISRADFNLIVPDLPFIANVSDEVKLEIDFVLVAS